MNGACCDRRSLCVDYCKCAQPVFFPADWYAVWSSGLAVLETTNSVFNHSLYGLIKPQSLWAWQRVRAANLMAGSGGQWSDTFASYNSG